MSNPSAETADTTKLVQPPATTKMVTKGEKTKCWIKAIHPIHLNNVTMSEGMVAQVDEKVAKEFCDRKFEGYYNFDGEMSSRHATKNQIVRAVRIDESTAKQLQAEWEKRTSSLEAEASA